MNTNIGQFISDTWARMLQVTPMPPSVLLEHFDTTSTYREKLDRPRINWLGDQLTRRQVLEYNLSLWKRLPPRPLPL